MLRRKISIKEIAELRLDHFILIIALVVVLWSIKGFFSTFRLLFTFTISFYSNLYVFLLVYVRLYDTSSFITMKHIYS